MVLMQWFGFISHSPCEAIYRKADFMCKGISALLKHKCVESNFIIYNVQEAFLHIKTRMRFLTCVSASA